MIKSAVLIEDSEAAGQQVERPPRLLLHDPITTPTSVPTPAPTPAPVPESPKTAPTAAPMPAPEPAPMPIQAPSGRWFLARSGLPDSSAAVPPVSAFMTKPF